MSVGRPRKPKIGKAVIDAITPDRAEIKLGGSIVHAKVEWDREKKERIRQLRNRMNA